MATTTTDMPTPKWTYWAGQAVAKVWECSALSVNVEPRELGLTHFLALRSRDAKFPWLSQSDPDWLHALCERNHEILASLRGSDGHDDPPPEDYDLEIPLPKFFRWVRGKDWKLPLQLHELAERPASAQPPSPPRQAASKANGSTPPASASAAPARAEPPVDGQARHQVQQDNTADEPAAAELHEHSAAVYQQCIAALLEHADIDLADRAASLEALKGMVKARRLKLSTRAIGLILTHCSEPPDTQQGADKPLGEQALKSHQMVLAALLKALKLAPREDATTKTLHEWVAQRGGEIPQALLASVLKDCATFPAQRSKKG